MIEAWAGCPRGYKDSYMALGYQVVHHMGDRSPGWPQTGNPRYKDSYMALGDQVVHHKDDGGLSASSPKQVQSTNGLQCCLGHANGAGIEFHLSMVGLVSPLPYAVVLRKGGGGGGAMN